MSPTMLSVISRLLPLGIALRIPTVAHASPSTLRRAPLRALRTRSRAHYLTTLFSLCTAELSSHFPLLRHWRQKSQIPSRRGVPA
eukprot:2927485-Pyramimonas_sp.AAC.1